MEKKLTISDIFFFVNQSMEKEMRLRVLSFDDFGFDSEINIRCDNFNIYFNKKTNEITLSANNLNSVTFHISDMEAAQYMVLLEKVKEYSKNKAIDSFLNYFKEEDNTPKTMDNIDD